MGEAAGKIGDRTATDHGLPDGRRQLTLSA